MAFLSEMHSLGDIGWVGLGYISLEVILEKRGVGAKPHLKGAKPPSLGNFCGIDLYSLCSLLNSSESQ